MFTLHTLSEEIKKILKWLGIGFGVIISIFLLIKGGFFVKKTFFPDPPPPPTVSFGKLPKINFPPTVTDKTLAYSIDTVSGKLPAFPDRLSVIKLLVKESSLFDLDRAREKAKILGFNFDGYAVAVESSLTPVLYEWDSPDSLKKKLTMNIISNNFRLTSNYINSSLVLNPSYIPTEDEVKNKINSILTQMGLLTTDIDVSKTRTELLTISDNTLTPADSISSTDIIRVDLRQKDINKLPVVYPHPPYSTMNFFVAGNDFQGDVVQASFIHQELTKEDATYPIKSATQAFDELQQGKAYIANYNNTGNSIQITDISLGYLQTEDTQEYLQPVVIFSGRGGFMAYLSAITDSWYQTSGAKQDNTK